MKKLLCLLCAFTLVLASCSSDDDNSSDSNSASSILPKTIKFTSQSYSSENSTSTFVYNGNKIVSIKDENSRYDYTYDGNLIVKITTYSVVSGHDLKFKEDSYTYANNKLVTNYSVYGFDSVYPEGQSKTKSVYTYNSDGTVKTESYRIDPVTNIVTKNNTEYVRTYVNGNIVKVVHTDADADYSYTAVYEYDSKNNPFKNITGYNLLLESGKGSSVNNVIKATFTSSWGNFTSGTSDVYQTDYLYDANGYPTKQMSYLEDGMSPDENNKTVDGLREYTY